MKPKVSEHEIQSAIIDWLKIKRIFSWRNNSGVMRGSYKGKQRLVRFGAVGSPDIFAVKNGQIFGIEVKAQKGIASTAQCEFAAELLRAGGTYILARSLEDVTKVLES